MNRLQQKNDLLIKLGALFGPIMHLAERPDEYDEQDRIEIIARYCAEFRIVQRDFTNFSEGQPGHSYEIECRDFWEALRGVRDDIMSGRGDLLKIVHEHLHIAQAAIVAVPIPKSSSIIEAGTPFSTYCALKDLCETDPAKELAWIDAYLDMSIFHRFLRGVGKDVMVTLVTSEPRSNAGARDRARWNEFLDISRLFSQERGNKHYRLVVHQSLLHDRWLLLDNKRLYSLGGSAKDAGNKQYFTLARLDASSNNLNAIQTHLHSGTEYFGVNTSHQ